MNRKAYQPSPPKKSWMDGWMDGRTCQKGNQDISRALKPSTSPAGDENKIEGANAYGFKTFGESLVGILATTSLAHSHISRLTLTHPLIRTCKLYSFVPSLARGTSPAGCPRPGLRRRRPVASGPRAPPLRSGPPAAGWTCTPRTWGTRHRLHEHIHVRVRVGMRTR